MKVLILGEMAVLFGGGLVLANRNGEPWADILLSRVWKQGLAVAILLALLTFLADVGLADFAAALGGLMVLGYLGSAGHMLGQQVIEMEKGLFA